MLLQIQGKNEMTTKASEVDALASSLNSADSFVLFSPPKSSERNYIWHGKGANATERSMCKSVFTLLSTLYKGDGNIDELNEGEETRVFWRTLNGQANYANFDSLTKVSAFSSVL